MAVHCRNLFLLSDLSVFHVVIKTKIYELVSDQKCMQSTFGLWTSLFSSRFTFCSDQSQDKHCSRYILSPSKRELQCRSQTSDKETVIVLEAVHLCVCVTTVRQRIQLLSVHSTKIMKALHFDTLLYFSKQLKYGRPINRGILWTSVY